MSDQRINDGMRDPKNLLEDRIWVYSKRAVLQGYVSKKYAERLLTLGLAYALTTEDIVYI